MKSPFVIPLLALFAVPAHAQHAGHVQPAPQDHAQHQAPASQPAPSPFPEPTAEERAAAFPDLGDMDMSAHMQEDPWVASLRVDQLEWHEDETSGVNLRASAGRSFDKLVLRSEAEKPRGEDVDGDAELLWSHATGPWWDRVVGLRSDFGDGPSRQWLALGVVGLAPYKFEVAATAYLGASGRLAARLEGEYEILLTNQWILQPKLEANLFSRDDVENGIGKGLSDAEFGLRLRYEFSPQFAPYVGYSWSRKFGATGDLAEAAGERATEQGWVAGLRFWF
ncbi:copper resistance protein B [Pseudoxanthomonas gei]|uniref:Copper resistance protein B n=1 Tax=Pseudoxanthomonas gei TaxID=1383030 RepID=A0ABX0A9X0_9GAMM|nr:copper resistance protein B [Pseudoxanthomonas gei]NDK37447.1 copper resistance protein B [Pseudoxanthomonas gei]